MLDQAPTYGIVGYDGCSYHARAIDAARAAGVSVAVLTLPRRSAFRKLLARPSVAAALGGHATSPAVFRLASGGVGEPTAGLGFSLDGAALVGGCDDLLAALRLPTLAEKRRKDVSSRSPDEVAALFQRLQSQHRFVVWVLWRGAW